PLNFSTTELTGAAATKVAVVEKLPVTNWVHLATHGYFVEDDWLVRNRVLTRGVQIQKRQWTARSYNRNPLVESGLVFAGAGNLNAEGYPVGLLTAEELIGLNLGRAQMVTLSACDTGRGEKGVVGQGVMGLRASIMAAGARSIVMSLWKVPDVATTKLMTAF